MKKVIYIAAFTVSFLSISCKDGGKIPRDANSPKMKFESIVHDFGTITEGDKVETEFVFKNIGRTDLLISDAKGSCGCTVPEYPKEPLKSGETGKIKVSFNSAHKTGSQTKTVTLFTNTENKTEILTIKAAINPMIEIAK
jgi:hypothetical protein